MLTYIQCLWPVHRVSITEIYSKMPAYTAVNTDNNLYG